MTKGQTSQWKSSQQCNNQTIKQISLPIQLVSSKNNYKNEVMHQNKILIFMTTKNPQKYIQTVQWTPQIFFAVAKLPRKHTQRC